MEPQPPLERPQSEHWRLRKHQGRTRTQYDFAARKSVETDPKLPERLYRQVPVADLYMLWRDQELPLQPFEGSHHSRVEENSVGNFWFTEPVSFDTVEVYIVTEPAQWRQLPEYVQASQMSFKSDKKRAEMGEWGVWQPATILSSVPEIHTGNRLRMNELTAFVSHSCRMQLIRHAMILQKVGNGSASSEESRELQIELGKLIEREQGLPTAELGQSEYAIRERLGELRLADPVFRGRLQVFYEWAQQLPVIPPNAQPADVEHVTNDKEASSKNEAQFRAFYDNYKGSREAK